MRYGISLLCLLVGCAPANREQEPLPIIDVHLHTLSGTAFGNPPGIETPPGVEWASTDEGLFEGTFAAFDRLTLHGAFEIDDDAIAFLARTLHR